MDAGQQRDQDGERDADVDQGEEGPEPPRRPVEGREDGGVAEGEALADPEVDDEAEHPGPVGILAYEGAEQQAAGPAG